VGINNEMFFKQVPQAIDKQIECESNKYLKYQLANLLSFKSKINYFTKSNLQKKVEQQHWVAFSNKYFKHQVTIPLFKKNVLAKKRNQFKQIPQITNGDFHVVSFTKNTNKNEKNLL
jgi:hypothetical protein